MFHALVCLLQEAAAVGDVADLYQQLHAACVVVLSLVVATYQHLSVLLLTQPVPEFPACCRRPRLP